MAYVYVHLKADSGEPFYVGMGDTCNRLWNMSKRSQFHKNIVAKHGVRVHSAVAYNVPWEIAQWWEERWIKALRAAGYELANHTDGGDGLKGFPAHNRRDVTCLETNDRFDSAIAAGKSLGMSGGTIADVCRGKYNSAGGLHFVYGNAPGTEAGRMELIRKLDAETAASRKKVAKNKNHPEPTNGRDCKGRLASGPLKSARRVLSKTDGIIFPSASSAARYYNVAKSAVIELCLGKRGRKSVGNIVFCYVDGE